MEGPMAGEEIHLSIDQVSRRLKIPKHTLRFWENAFEGILVPSRTQGGQRRYSPESIYLLEKIKSLRKREMSLAAIRRELTNIIKDGPPHLSKVDLLADRIAEVVKTEVYQFLRKNEHADYP